MNSKVFSFILILLLLLSVTVPTACAELPDGWKEPELGAAPVVVFVIPAVSDLVIDGMTIAIGSACVMKIGQELGIRWDDFVKTMGIVGETEKDTGEKTRIKDPAGNTVTVREPLWIVKENWEKFVSDVTNGINNFINENKQYDATSQEITTLMIEFSSGGQPKGKKDNESYFFEANRLFNNVKIKLKPISIVKAAARVKEGKNVMTWNKKWAEELANTVSKENRAAKIAKGETPKWNGEDEIKSEWSKKGQKGYYEHYHPKDQENGRPHIWIWSET